MQVKNQLQQVNLGRKFIKAEIPDNWKLLQLGNLGKVHGRIGWKNLRANEYAESGPLMLSVWSLIDQATYGVDYEIGTRRLSKFRYEESPEIQLQNNDVLLAKDGDIGRVGFVKKLPELSTVNSHVVVIRVTNSIIYPEYLYWYMKSKSFQTYCIAFTSGTTVPLFTQKDLRNAIIPIPSIPEQQKITSILSNVDSLIQQIQKKIEHIQKLKIGLVQKLLTKGIGHTKFKKTELEVIPEEWNLVKLKEIAAIKGGKRLPIGEQYSEEKTDYPYIRIVDFQNGTVTTNNLAYLQKSTFQKLKNYSISTKDVYISIVGSLLGIAGTIPPQLDGAILTENAAKLCNLKVNKEFLFYFLNSNIIQKQITSYRSNAGKPKLALFRIGKFIVFLPSLKEQNEIVSILSNIDSYLKTQQEYKSNLEILKKGLMQKLLTGQIRVKV